MNTSNLDIKSIIAKLAPLFEFAKKYSHFLYFIALACMVGYLVWHINGLNQAEPDDDAVTSKLKTVQRPRIDEKTLTQIQQLEDQNVEAKSLFDNARNNPFSEQ